jgi:hypothetical protein
MRENARQKKSAVLRFTRRLITPLTGIHRLGAALARFVGANRLLRITIQANR